MGRRVGVSLPPWLTQKAPTEAYESLAHLEEVDLHAAITEVQYDGAAGAEPGAQVGEPGQFIAFSRCDVGPGLQQVFTHIVPEILQQGDLEEQGSRGPQSAVERR